MCCFCLKAMKASRREARTRWFDCVSGTLALCSRVQAGRRYPAQLMPPHQKMTLSHSLSSSLALFPPERRSCYLGRRRALIGAEIAQMWKFNYRDASLGGEEAVEALPVGTAVIPNIIYAASNTRGCRQKGHFVRLESERERG